MMKMYTLFQRLFNVKGEADNPSDYLIVGKLLRIKIFRFYCLFSCLLNEWNRNESEKCEQIFNRWATK